MTDNLMTSNDSQSPLSPIFVVGSPRGGTHLMRFCLSRHSRIYVAPETNFFSSIYGRRRLLSESQLRQYSHAIVKQVFDSGDLSIHEFDHIQSSMREKIAREARSFRDLAIIIMREFAIAQGKPRWGEKTPFHLLYVDEILAMFPHAKIINMQRDPRNVVASSMRAGHVPTDFHWAVAQYRVGAKETRRQAARMLTVDYGRFTHDPEATLRQVAEYVGEAFEAEMLRPGMVDSSYGEKRMVRDAKIGILKEPEGKWRQTLSEGKAAFILAMTGGDGKKGGMRFWISRIRIVIRQLWLEANILKNRMGISGITKKWLPFSKAWRRDREN